MMGGQNYDDWDASQYHNPQAHQPVERERSTYLTDAESEKICALFADGLDSGISYARLLDLMERQRIEAKLVNRLRVAILEKGDQLGEAFARQGILDPVSRNLILVAEQQGNLPQTFRQLGKIYGDRVKRKREFISAMIEPLMLVALGLIVLRKLLTQTLMPDSHISTGAVLFQSLIEVLIFSLGCGFGFYFWLNLPVDFAPRSIAQRIWFRVPFLGSATRLHTIAMFCRYMRESINTGLDINRGLTLAIEASNNPNLLNGLRRAQASIEEGASLSKALASTHALPAEVIDHLDIGEEAGRIDERLDFLADRYEGLSAESFERTTTGITYAARMGIIIFVISSIFVFLGHLQIFH